MKLKRDIMMIFLVVSVLPLVAFGAFALRESSRKIDEMTECSLQAISENQIANIENFAKDRRNEMEMVAHYSLTTNAIHNLDKHIESDEDRKYLDNLLKERQKYGTYVASISVLNKDFRVVGSSEEYEISELSQLKDIDPKFHTGEFIMGNVYERVTDTGKKKMVPAYIGVYDEDETLIGYIAEELDTAYFDELRLNMDSLASGTFYLLDGKGAIITAGNTNQKQSIGGFVTSAKDREDFQEKWDSIDREKNPSGSIKYKYNGDRYITYYSNLENTDWSIRVTENCSAQTRSMNGFSIYLILIMATMIVGVILLENFFAQRIISPIQKAVQTFEDIRHTQDYSIRLSVDRKDELGNLAESVNELLSYAEIDKKLEKETRRQLQIQAEWDALTGVKNKKTIESTLYDMVADSVEKGEQITLGVLDVDNFRDFNTKYGHQAGDEVLKFVGETLQSNIEGEIGRMGGDEFVFCYVGEKQMQEIHSDMDRLLSTLRKGVEASDRKNWLKVPCSIGVVTGFEKEFDYTNLVREADKAMYEAKDAGRNTFVVNEI